MKIAALTMVWNDAWFLKRWIGYYAPLIGEENLYVVSHGPDPSLAAIVGNAHVIDVPRDPADIDFDQRRWAFLSSYASALTHYHDAVICSDVDELLVPTGPDVDVVAAIARMSRPAAHCVPGFELFPKDTAAGKVDGASRLAPHMEGAQFSPFYSKAAIIFRPGQFSPGAHGMIGERPELSNDLALMHLRFSNPDELMRRNALRADIAEGSITDREQYLEAGKAFATWRKSDKRTRTAFRSFRHSRSVSWEEILPFVQTELERLRVRRGKVHKFLTKNFEPLRAPLPVWMQSHF